VGDVHISRMRLPLEQLWTSGDRRVPPPECRTKLPRLAADGAPVLATQLPMRAEPRAGRRARCEHRPCRQIYAPQRACCREPDRFAVRRPKEVQGALVMGLV